MPRKCLNLTLFQVTGVIIKPQKRVGTEMWGKNTYLTRKNGNKFLPILMQGCFRKNG